MPPVDGMIVMLLSACCCKAHYHNMHPVAGHSGLRHLAALPALEQLDMSATFDTLPVNCRMPRLTALDMSRPATLLEVLSII